MELSIQEQIFDQLRKANKILIALPETLTADSVASGLALKLFLQKLQKDVEVVSSGRAADNLEFLPASDSIKLDITAGKSLVVTVDTSVKKLEEISYQTADSQASIYLKAKSQAFEPADISFRTDKFPVDAIVILDALSLEHLGRLFHDHADLFFETPKINIDHKAGNELYGNVNLVDVTASSVGEILAGLLEQFEEGLVDEDIATALLTGIITKTHSFQHSQTTPAAFLKASRLVGLGGRQQEIIKQLYKTKSLGLLKLWGRVLARLKTDEGLSLVYSSLNGGDFDKSQSSQQEVLPVARELLDNLAGYQLAAILAEQPDGNVRLVLAVHSALPPDQVLSALPAVQKSVLEWAPYRVFDFAFAGLSLAEAERQLLKAAELLRPLLNRG